MRKGKLYVVGIGPGDTKHLTLKARSALSESGVIVGYTPYIKLIKALIGRKKVIATGMRQETSRVRRAIEIARQGKIVSLVSSGDAGIYGMAGLVFQLYVEPSDSRCRKSKKYFLTPGVGRSSLEIEVIPGVTAASSCAALLGAPLTHDCALISLSDCLTEKKLILKRLALALEGNFTVVLYNPSSKSRAALFEQACGIINKFRKADVPVGIVRDAYRKGQRVKIIPLSELPKKTQEINMCTTIIIGNSQTRVKNGYMVTPRGYAL